MAALNARNFFAPTHDFLKRIISEAAPAGPSRGPVFFFGLTRHVSALVDWATRLPF